MRISTLADHPWELIMMNQLISEFQFNDSEVSASLVITDFYMINHQANLVDTMRAASFFEILTLEELFIDWQLDVESLEDSEELLIFLNNWENENCTNRTLSEIEKTNRFIFGYENDRFNYKVSKYWRLRILKDSIQWCEDYLDRFMPDIVVLIERANLIPNILEVLCSRRGIKVFTLMPSRIGDRWIVREDFGHGLSDFEFNQIFQSELDNAFIDEAEQFSKTLSSIRKGSYYSLAFEISERFKFPAKNTFSQIVKQIRDYSASLYGYVFIQPRIRAIKSIRRLEQNFFRVALFEFQCLCIRLMRISRVKSFGILETPSTRYLFWALHARPEGATIVAGHGLDEIDEIKKFARLLTGDLKILIKENPIMFGRRQRGFYKSLARIPNVLIADPFLNTFDCIENSTGVVGISGTALLEAGLMGKHVLILGKPEFDRCSSFRGWDSVQDFLSHIQESNSKNDRDKFLRYAAYVFSISNSEDIGYPVYVEREKFKSQAKQMVSLIKSRIVSAK